MPENKWKKFDKTAWTKKDNFSDHVFLFCLAISLMISIFIIFAAS